MSWGWRSWGQGLRVLVRWHFFLWLKSFYLNLFEYPRQGDEFFVCVSKFVLIFCLSSLYFLYSVCLYLFAYFLFVSILFLIFCLSHIISLFSVCLILFPYYLPVFISIHIFCLSPFIFSFSVCLSLSKMETQRKWGKDGDRQKIRKRMETDRKWENSWRQRYHMEKNGDRQKMQIKMEATRNLV